MFSESGPKLHTMYWLQKGLVISTTLTLKHNLLHNSINDRANQGLNTEAEKYRDMYNSL